MTSLKLTHLRAFFQWGTSNVCVSSCPFDSHERWVGFSVLPPCILIIHICNILLCGCNDDVTMSGRMHENGAHGCKAMSISLILELKILECIGHLISCNEYKAKFSLQPNESSQPLKCGVFGLGCSWVEGGPNYQGQGNFTSLQPLSST